MQLSNLRLISIFAILAINGHVSCSMGETSLDLDTILTTSLIENKDKSDQNNSPNSGVPSELPKDLKTVKTDSQIERSENYYQINKEVFLKDRILFAKVFSSLLTVGTILLETFFYYKTYSIKLPHEPLNLTPNAEKLISDIFQITTDNIKQRPTGSSSSDGCRNGIIYLSQVTVDLLNSDNRTVQNIALSILAHELTHTINNHGLKSFVAEAAVFSSLSYFGFKAWKKIQSITYDWRINVWLRNKINNTGYGEYIESLFDMFLALVGTCAVWKVSRVLSPFLIKKTIDRWHEWEADNFTGLNLEPRMLYDLLKGRRYLMRVWVKIENKYSWWQYFEQLLTDEHPSSHARLANVEKRIDALKAQYNFPD